MFLEAKTVGHVLKRDPDIITGLLDIFKSGNCPEPLVIPCGGLSESEVDLVTRHLVESHIHFEEHPEPRGILETPNWKHHQWSLRK